MTLLERIADLKANAVAPVPNPIDVGLLTATEARGYKAAANEALPLIEELQALLAATAADRNSHYELCRVYEKRLEAADGLLRMSRAVFEGMAPFLTNSAKPVKCLAAIYEYFAKDKDNR